MAPRKASSKSETVAALKERRAKQQEEILSIVNVLEECIAKARGMRIQFELLSSVSQGLYDELDKLSKKAPAEPVSAAASEKMGSTFNSPTSVLKSASDVIAFNFFQSLRGY